MEVDLNDNKRFQSLNALENRLLLLAEAGCVITLTPNQSAEYPYILNLKGPNAHMSVASAKVYDSIETLYYSYLQCTGLNTLIKESEAKRQTDDKFEAALKATNEKHGGALKKLAVRY